MWNSFEITKTREYIPELPAQMHILVSEITWDFWNPERFFVHAIDWTATIQLPEHFFKVYILLFDSSQKAPWFYISLNAIHWLWEVLRQADTQRLEQNWPVCASWAACGSLFKYNSCAGWHGGCGIIPALGSSESARASKANISGFPWPLPVCLAEPHPWANAARPCHHQHLWTVPIASLLQNKVGILRLSTQWGFW